MSTAPTTEKSARISCRISPVVKEHAETAARYLGKSITEFTETALEEKAQSVIAENERIVLSERDFKEFLIAISAAPPEPTKELLAAIEEYKQHRPIVERKI